ncbi:hypothetical protein LCGC14_2139170, partial [marine sediment metagenome]
AYWQKELSAPLRGIWLDVEATAGVHPDQIEDLRGAGIVPGIYASRNSWSNIMGADTRFTDVPLWVAHYRQGPWPTALREGDLPYVPNSWHPDLVVGWQWMGTTTLLDEQFDLNVFSEAFIQGLYKDAPPVEEGAAMSSKEAEALRAWVQQSVHDPIVARVAALEQQVEALHSGAPAPPKPSPPAPPSRKFVIVSPDDTAGKWFPTEGALLRLNPNFPRVAYGKDGHILRRFAPDRDWHFIIPDERLWTS